MQRFHRLSIALACLAALAAPLRAAPLPPEFMPASEIRPGMTGYGLTVFQGFKVERFPVEILGVERNGLPGSDMIIARASGPYLEGHGVVAGMSGSPVFIDGRLIGALAYGWEFSYVPLCGITPIESMWQVWEAIGREGVTHPGVESGRDATPSPPAIVSAGPSSSSAWDWEPAFNAFAARLEGAAPAALSAPQSGLGGFRPTLPALRDTPGRLRPLMAPLFLAGGTPEVEERLRRFFAGRGVELFGGGPVSSAIGAAGNGPSPPIENGSALGIPLLYGDMNLSGIGTVTWRSGDRLIAFGHPMFAEGAVRFPMAQAYVFGFMESYMRSFKLGEVRDIVGTIEQDRFFAIGGRFGAIPSFVPITVRVSGEASPIARPYHYQCWENADLMPMLASAAVDSSWRGAVSAGGEMTLASRYTIRLADGTLIQKRLINSSMGFVIGPTTRSIMFDLFMLLGNPFREADVASIEVDLEARRGRLEQSELVSVIAERSRYKAGEPVALKVRLRPWRGEETVLPLTFELPADLEAGPYVLHLVDAQGAQTIQRLNRPGIFAPYDFDDIVELVQSVGVPDDELRLYAFAPATDLELKGEPMKGMPATLEGLVRQTAPLQLQQQAVGRLVGMKTLPADRPVFGSASILIEVVDHFDE